MGYQIGDTVKALNNLPLDGNSVAPPLVLGVSYPVVDVYKCKCGQEHLNVGLVSKYNYVNCYKCSNPLPNGDKIHWAHPIRFELA